MCEEMFFLLWWGFGNKTYILLKWPFGDAVKNIHKIKAYRDAITGVLECYGFCEEGDNFGASLPFGTIKHNDR